MTSAEYTYSISEDFTNNAVDTSKLKLEIEESSIIISLERIDTNGDNCNVWFKYALSTTDKITLDALIFNHDGIALIEPQNPVASNNAPIIQVQPLEGSRINFVSPNWCDKTTWYETSQRIIDETMINIGDNINFKLSEDCYLVDVTHGKITHEHLIESTYKPIVKVDGIEKVENSPGELDGEFSIAYNSCYVTFNSALNGDEIVTISFSKIIDSQWSIVPTEGKKLRIVEVEVQLSGDGELTDNIVFQAYAEVGKFPPLDPYSQDNGGPYPNGTSVPIGTSTKYKTVMDFINESNCSYPIIKLFGGTSWRGLKSDINIFRWEYMATKDLYSKYGMKLIVVNENHKEHNGSQAVCTMYCVSEEE